METHLETYRRLEQELQRMRRAFGAVESPDEDALLDQMDVVWFKLTEQEKQAVDQTRSCAMPLPLIVIPVLNRFDLLKQAVERYDALCDILVINNNTVDRADNHELRLLQMQDTRVEAWQQTRNLGCGASWDLGLCAARERGLGRVYIGSNDCMLGAGVLAQVLAFQMRENERLLLVHDFNFFVMDTRITADVGKFDEGCWPGYFADNDFYYRCALAGFPAVHVTTEEAGDRLLTLDIQHLGSQTINSNPNYKQRNHTTFEQAKAYYVSKWGGMPRHEKFKHPFNDPQRDWRWVADVDVTSRDWDRP